jgi:hydrogenase maturation protein HypF
VRPDVRRVEARLEGIVQGVGFRPYVHRLAAEFGLGGGVGNDVRGVFVEVEGPGGAVSAFLEALPARAPSLALIESMEVVDLPPRGERTFTIVESAAGGPRRSLVSPDVATCSACLDEIRDPAARRHRYAFTNCTDCGPRYTITRDVPYDRPATTMAGFTMCADCEREYTTPHDRRFHAQPICCPACGPTLRLVEASGAEVGAIDPLSAAARLLASGRVVAVKGLGGYHLATLASDETATATLRGRKHREDKPFAVMVADVGAAERLAHLDAAAVDSLTSPPRPIVIAPRRPGTAIAPAVAPRTRTLGLFLPYTPLHHLLLDEVGVPLVMTSGNVSDEPIAYLDTAARAQLGSIADAFLTHDRPIHVRADDSIVRASDGGVVPIRRSRGYVPAPITSPWRSPRPVLAVGAELKSTVCLAKGHRAFLSHHIGDLADYETFRSFTGAIEHLGRLFDVTPEVVAHDLHPDYLSTHHAEGLPLRRVAVQHHHAHIAACLADNHHPGPVIGVAFDGTGYGADGTLWGGEILVADLARFERVGHLAPVALPGGEAAIREPWRAAVAYLEAAFPGGVPEDLAIRDRHDGRWEQVVAVSRAPRHAPASSSAGRLFDAVAAVLGVRDAVTYEGQAAIELEQLADPSVENGYPVAVRGGEPSVLDGPGLLRVAVEDLQAGTAVPVIAARFHVGLADVVARVCRAQRSVTGLDTVALSGGVFQNVLLTRRLRAQLERQGFTVLEHRRVPCNDGGISLGQAAVASARDRAEVASGAGVAEDAEDTAAIRPAPPG